MNSLRSKTRRTTIEVTRESGLCTGCGLCSVACPSRCISMCWRRGRWVPAVDASRCTDCGQCLSICPATPERISEYALAAAKAGECFGLPPDAACVVGYDLDPDSRARSASGGLATALLRYLLSKGEIDGVIASDAVRAPIGQPHYACRLFETPDELETARSSHYHPVCYDRVLSDVSSRSGRYVLVGLPCVIRGVERLPSDLRAKIRFTVGLACNHNVSSHFLDYLARRAGVGEGEPFTANQRDKHQLQAAWDFNTCFVLSDRTLRERASVSGWAEMWRNLFFALDCCLYCPDFYAADADVSIKDAWGKWKEDGLGTSMVISRSPRITSLLESMRTEGLISLEKASVNEVFLGQADEPRFKHVQVFGRLARKRRLRKEMEKNGYHFAKWTRWLSRASIRYWQLRFMASLSEFCYSHFKSVPVGTTIGLAHAVSTSLSYARSTMRRITTLRRACRPER